MCVYCLLPLSFGFFSDTSQKVQAHAPARIMISFAPAPKYTRTLMLRRSTASSIRHEFPQSSSVSLLFKSPDVRQNTEDRGARGAAGVHCARDGRVRWELLSTAAAGTCQYLTSHQSWQPDWHGGLPAQMYPNSTSPVRCSSSVG